MKHKFGNYIYTYHFKDKLNIFCSFFVELSYCHIHGGHDKLNYNLYAKFFKHYIVKFWPILEQSVWSTYFNAKSTRNASEMIRGIINVTHLGIHPGPIPLTRLYQPPLTGTTCSYMTPTYLRRLYKYAYNKHIDTLCDIEWNKGPCSIWFLFCSPMFVPAFPWYQQVGGSLAMNGCKDQRLSTLPCLPPLLESTKSRH